MAAQKGQVIRRVIRVNDSSLFMIESWPWHCSEAAVTVTVTMPLGPERQGPCQNRVDRPRSPPTSSEAPGPGPDRRTRSDRRPPESQTRIKCQVDAGGSGFRRVRGMVASGLGRAAPNPPRQRGGRGRLDS